MMLNKKYKKALEKANELGIIAPEQFASIRILAEDSYYKIYKEWDKNKNSKTLVFRTYLEAKEQKLKAPKDNNVIIITIGPERCQIIDIK